VEDLSGKILTTFLGFGNKRDQPVGPAGYMI
jgi:hypothetical protein